MIGGKFLSTSAGLERDVVTFGAHTWEKIYHFVVGPTFELPQRPFVIRMAITLPCTSLCLDVRIGTPV